LNAVAAEPSRPLPRPPKHVPADCLRVEWKAKSFSQQYSQPLLLSIALPSDLPWPLSRHTSAKRLCCFSTVASVGRFIEKKTEGSSFPLPLPCLPLRSPLSIPPSVCYFAGSSDRTALLERIAVPFTRRTPLAKFPGHIPQRRSATLLASKSPFFTGFSPLFPPLLSGPFFSITLIRWPNSSLSRDSQRRRLV